MKLLHDDIIYLVNVDGQQVPYAMSAVGKTDVQDRLQLLLDTFVVTKFAAEWIVHEDGSSRSLVHGVYLHKRTGEILDVKVRFRAWIVDGLITRMEEMHDARFVRDQQTSASCVECGRGRSNGRIASGYQGKRSVRSCLPTGAPPGRTCR